MMRLPMLFSILISSAALAQSNVLVEAPVKITADFKSATKPGSDTVTTFNVAINQVTHEFRMTASQRGTAADAFTAQKARTGWKDGYLFIRDDCQAASEDKRNWRCVVDQVFTFVDSRDGKRLVHVGDVFAGEDCIDEVKIGCALYKGDFTDIYDALETNPLLSRAESPALLLEMHVVSGEFVVDLDETWGRNQERYSAGERCLVAKKSERAELCTDGINPRRAYVFNSVLAAYTRRSDQLDRVRAMARSALCDEKTEIDCSEILRRSALMLAAVRPGEKPRSRGNVQSIPLQAKR